MLRKGGKMDGKIILSALRGMAIGLAASLILLLAFNFIAMKGADPDKPLSAFAYITQALGAGASGFAAAKFSKEKGLVTGALAGVMYAFVIILGAIITKGNFSFLSAIITAVASVGIASVFGILGLPTEKSKSASYKSMMKRLAE